MNQHNGSTDESRRIINVPVTGSKEGAVEIPHLTVGFEKTGTKAPMAGILIEKLAAHSKPWPHGFPNLRLPVMD